MLSVFLRTFLLIKKISRVAAKLEKKSRIFTLLFSASTAGGATNCGGGKQANQTKRGILYWRRILTDFRLEGFLRILEKEKKKWKY